MASKDTDLKLPSSTKVAATSGLSPRRAQQKLDKDKDKERAKMEKERDKLEKQIKKDSKAIEKKRKEGDVATAAAVTSTFPMVTFNGAEGSSPRSPSIAHHGDHDDLATVHVLSVAGMETVPPPPPAPLVDDDHHRHASDDVMQHKKSRFSASNIYGAIKSGTSRIFGGNSVDTERDDNVLDNESSNSPRYEDQASPSGSSPRLPLKQRRKEFKEEKKGRLQLPTTGGLTDSRSASSEQIASGVLNDEDLPNSVYIKRQQINEPISPRSRAMKERDAARRFTFIPSLITPTIDKVLNPRGWFERREHDSSPKHSARDDDSDSETLYTVASDDPKAVLPASLDHDDDEGSESTTETEKEAGVYEKISLEGHNGKYTYVGGGIKKLLLKTPDKEFFAYKVENTVSGHKRFYVPHGKGQLTKVTSVSQRKVVYEGKWKFGRKCGRGKGEFKSEDGVTGEYSGQWQEDAPHGEGTFTAEGIKYSGGWKKGQFEGKGTLVRINFTYVGRWKDNKQQGLGVATWKDGTSYEGEWGDGTRCGYGICRFANGDRYMGEWKANMRCGPGSLVVAETGNRYVGNWQKDKRHGQGILYSPTNQKIYEGQWWKNMRNGQGSVWNLDGSSYHGEWVNNMKDGYGKKLWIDMSSYEGMWKLDKKHAMGSEKLANGDYYTGMFVENLRHGQGILLWKKFGHAVLCFAAVDSLLNRSPSKYVGEFVDGFPKGKGYYKSADGQKIEGEFSWAVARKEPDGEFTGLLSDDLKYGYGIKKFENGNSYEGEWFNGKYQGFGEYTRANGATFEGTWLKNMLTGVGKQRWPNGDVFEGQWLVNKREGLGSMKFSSTGVEVECKWKDNAMTNPVVYRWSDGRSFHGDLVDDKPHGLGTLFVPSTDEKAPGVDKYTLTWEKGAVVPCVGKAIYANGDTYEGQFQGLAREGHGIIRYGSKNDIWTGMWEGDWKNNHRHGYGKKTEKEGDEIIGVWKENRLNGFARLTVSSGGVFTGTYTEGQRHGCGIFEWPDGKLSFREYRRDLLVETRQIDSIPAYITEAVKTIEAGYAEITSRILNRGAGR